MNSFKKFGFWLVLTFLIGCGGLQGTGTTKSASGDAAATTVRDATNKAAPTVDVPGGTASASESVPVSEAGKSASVSKAITLGGATGTGNEWMLNVAEQMADHIVKSAEGVFFKDNDGEDSMLSAVFAVSTTGDKKATNPKISGPAEIGNFSGGADFASFTGCASNGVFHLPTSTNPLSMTVFIGTSLISLSRVASACLTSADPVRGTVWVNPQTFFDLFKDGRTAPPTFRMKMTVDESVSSSSDSSCPFTTCKKFSTLMFTSGGTGSSHFGSFPSAFNGNLYLNASNEKQFKVATQMTFPSNQAAGPCITMNGFLINVQSDGSQVAGKFQMTIGGSTVTRANGGIATTGTSSAGECSVVAASIETTVSDFATGACADSTGTLLAAGACSIDNDPNLLLTDPSTASVETDTQFPSDAPTTF